MLIVVAAFRAEVGAFLRAGNFRRAERRQGLCVHRSRTMPDVAVIEGAIGIRRARTAAKWAADSLNADAVVSAGFAAAAQPGTLPGDTFLCDRLMFAGSTAESCGRIDLPALPGGHGASPSASCLTLPYVAAASGEKLRLGTAWGVDLVDMESFAVAQVCKRHGLRCGVVRSVFDTAEQTLPPFVSEYVNSGGTSQGGIKLTASAAMHSIVHPATAAMLWRLRAQRRIASDSLANALTKLVHQITSHQTESRSWEHSASDTFAPLRAK